MKILHTVAGLGPSTGGPVASVSALCRGLAERGHQVCLLTGTGQLHPDVEALPAGVRRRQVPLGPYTVGHWSPEFGRASEDEGRNADVVHDHGVWLYTNRASARAAARTGRPLVRSTRGMLSAWALSRSRLRKRLVWWAIERDLFRQTSVVHATSASEEADIRRAGVTVPVAVVPNGVDVVREFARERVEKARDLDSPGRRVVFLGRIHPVKGIDLLQRAWANLAPGTQCELLIAGEGAGGEVAQVRAWVGQRQGPPARYLGPVAGGEKLRLLASAWVLILPSHSENYGMVVAEALACGTPVITTRATPWAGLLEHRCGWWVADEEPPLEQALREALGVGPTEHAAMRARARAFVEAEHSAGAAVRRMEGVYQGALERAHR